MFMSDNYEFDFDEDFLKEPFKDKPAWPSNSVSCDRDVQNTNVLHAIAENKSNVTSQPSTSFLKDPMLPIISFEDIMNDAIEIFQSEDDTMTKRPNVSVESATDTVVKNLTESTPVTLSSQQSDIQSPGITYDHDGPKIKVASKTSLLYGHARKVIILKRKFPGPAGILPQRPEKSPKFDESTTIVNSSLVPSVETPTSNTRPIICSQKVCSTDVCDAAWHKFSQHFDMKSNLLNPYNVAWIKKRAAARQLIGRKVPFLAAVIKHIDFICTDPSILFEDATGSIFGTVHRDIAEEFSSQLKVGSLVVLNQMGVVSTGYPTRRHYLNITKNNMLAIYDCPMGDATNVRLTKIRDVSGERLRLLINTTVYHNDTVTIPSHDAIKNPTKFTAIAPKPSIPLLPNNLRVNQPARYVPKNLNKAFDKVLMYRTPKEIPSNAKSNTKVIKVVMIEAGGRSILKSSTESKIMQLSDKQLAPLVPAPSSNISDAAVVDNVVSVVDEGGNNFLDGFDCSSLFEDF